MENSDTLKPKPLKSSRLQFRRNSDLGHLENKDNEEIQQFVDEVNKNRKAGETVFKTLMRYTTEM